MTQPPSDDCIRRGGVGRTAHGDEQLGFFLVRVQFDDLRLLDDDLLARLRVGERSGLLRQRRGFVDFRLETGLLDLAVALRLRFERCRLLLALGRFLIGLRLRDARVALHRRGVRLGEVVDVARRVVDLLNLQRVDDQPELLHLGAGRTARRFGELVALADQIFDGERAADCAQMAREHLLNARVHAVLLVEETARGVGDRREVVTDLVDHHPFDVDRNALLGDARDLELGLAQVERKPAHHLHARNDQRAAAGDDLEPE